MGIAIKVEDLSKAYQLGEFGTGTISRDIERFWAKLRGKEDPFLKIGETNDRARKGDSDVVWSLRDINFEIEQGDAVGFIGRNGAGKSTLLKVLSRVTAPTSGTVKIKGRIASLLEVGTGFHPELTGRENIFLNGAILGMRKAEIKRRFDEIVDFAGVERYIDTPVKRYSSGMYVRLAFGVAAHLESEILIIDEVLAVGDAEFQKKCLGKMNDVSKGEGRTVLFVSHNMAAVKSLCGKGFVLNDGEIIEAGDINRCITSYINKDKESNHEYTGDNIIKRANIQTIESCSGTINLVIKIQLSTSTAIKNLVAGFLIKDMFDTPIIALNNRHYSNYESSFQNINSGELSISLPDLPLLTGEYKVDIFIGDRLVDIEIISDALSFTISEQPSVGPTFTIDKNLNKFAVKNAQWGFIE